MLLQGTAGSGKQRSSNDSQATEFVCGSELGTVASLDNNRVVGPKPVWQDTEGY